MKEKFKAGMVVKVSHLSGSEIGIIDSINYATNKVTLAFGEGANLTFCGFSITQIEKVGA